MNYRFSSSFNGKVVETKWLGKLTDEIIEMGIKDRESWIKKNTFEKPKFLVSDYTDANVEQITITGLRRQAKLFKDLQDNYPGIQWIAITPTVLQFGLARMWQVFVEDVLSKTYVVKSHFEAEEIIAQIYHEAQTICA